MLNKYKITGFIVCHDIRFSGYISTETLAQCEPSTHEATKLLHPKVKDELEKYSGNGYPYDLISVKTELA